MAEFSKLGKYEIRGTLGRLLFSRARTATSWAYSKKMVGSV